MTGSSTWMIPLLLLALFASFLQSNPVPWDMLQFGKNLDHLKYNVTHCSENCTSNQTDSTCKCLHLDVTQKCDKYFIDGLKALHTNISSQIQIKHLINMLEKMHQKHPSFSFCPPSGGDRYEPVISPKSLHKNLAHVTEFYNSRYISG